MPKQLVNREEEGKRIVQTSGTISMINESSTMLLFRKSWERDQIGVLFFRAHCMLNVTICTATSGGIINHEKRSKLARPPSGLDWITLTCYIKW